LWLLQTIEDFQQQFGQEQQNLAVALALAAFVHWTYSESNQFLEDLELINDLRSLIEPKDETE
jgi:hypothetical protein